MNQFGSTLVAGMTDEYAERAVSRQRQVAVSESRNVIANLPPDVERDLRLRAVHAPPRSFMLRLDEDSMALLQSEIALELARLYIDLTGPTA
jgi:hypothetical protein